ncbi:PREDICTED: PRUPE_5G044300 [Prunus dulcis]|uniref:PREDICTED: PRUPE_5G044300 n=1 Tax=Prunus dulcis TaxID=3755 RepID=A0A5E4GG45_PRUDU|nr:PREDICTED: PRUPE_5G044300 [Prunus dulcis]
MKSKEPSTSIYRGFEACVQQNNKKQKQKMSHSGGAMKLMMVMMAMALLTTSHGIGIHINTSVITGGYSASRCNGLTDTACRIAHSELDFDLEFMLDSEFSIRLLQTNDAHLSLQALVATSAQNNKKQKQKMSHSGGAMKLMMVMMAMALLTTSHGIGIHINTSVITGGYSASRCNGLTDTACRIAHSELDFDLEFMLDSEFSIRLLQTNDAHLSLESLVATSAASCNRVGNTDSCHDKGNNPPIPDNCKKEPTNRGCYGH